MSLYSHKKKEEFIWSEDKRVCKCRITTRFGSFEGQAFCHEADLDMLSRITGEQIAYSRALIKMMQYEKNCILRPSITALKHVLSIADSNPSAAHILKRQINNLEFGLTCIKDCIQGEKDWLKEYIDEKEKMYQKIRNKREKK